MYDCAPVSVFYVPKSPKYFRIILPQGICTSEGYKGTFAAHFHDEHDSYTELNFNNDKSGWYKAKSIYRVYIKYHQNNNLTTCEYLLPNQREK